MATDMDIDMDLDIDPVADDMMLETQTAHNSSEIQAMVPGTPHSIVLSDSEANQPVPNKIHLRGLDNLTSSDIKAFATEYFDIEEFEEIEWIDDTSANLVYATPALASQALFAFLDTPISDISQYPHLQMLQAKPIPACPDSRLQVRAAVLGDRKKAGARERSRFYLFNPEHDPAERRKRDGYTRRGGRRYRDRDDDNRPAREGGHSFDASLYDDDEITRANRAATRGGEGAKLAVSPGEHAKQDSRKFHSSRGAGRELFPDRMSRRRGGSGRLRDRSASPSRETDRDTNMNVSQAEQSESRIRHINLSGSANRVQAQMIKARLKEASLQPKELFPQKASVNHRRSDAFDATDAAVDLFAATMSVPFLDGSSDDRPQNNDLVHNSIKTKLEDRVSLAETGDQRSFNIRGTARQQKFTGFSIKGLAVAPGPSARELFPSKVGPNSEKELFSGKLEGRGGSRRRAEDMFH